MQDQKSNLSIFSFSKAHLSLVKQITVFFIPVVLCYALLEISVLNLPMSYKKINTRNKDQIRHAIYWHHAKPIRKMEFKKLEVVHSKLTKNIGDGAFNEVLHVARQVVSSVNQMSLEYDGDEPLLVDGLLSTLDEDKVYDLAKEDFPAYKTYLESNDDVADYGKNIKQNAHNNIARSSVITADRLVSGLSREALDNHIKEKTLDTLLVDALVESSELTQKIKDCLTGFETRFPNSERNEQQKAAAIAFGNMAESSISTTPH